MAGTGKLHNFNCNDYGNNWDCRDESYGDYFQRGNNYGFASSGAVSGSSELVPNASNYGPLSYYSGSTFITQPGVNSSSKRDYWKGGQNDNLR
ncbi:MAG: hypothetical protein LBG59_00010 [Candidatus Peribacteria bacterium]|nr:hypothetical protein [Candidatus Peribacteria bacterium]